MGRSLRLFVGPWQVEKALNVAGDDILYVGDHSAPHAGLPSVTQDSSVIRGCQSRSPSELIWLPWTGAGFSVTATFALLLWPERVCSGVQSTRTRRSQRSTFAGGQRSSCAPASCPPLCQPLNTVFILCRFLARSHCCSNTQR